MVTLPPHTHTIKVWPTRPGSSYAHPETWRWISWKEPASQLGEATTSFPLLWEWQELAGNEPTLCPTGPAHELLMPRADVCLQGLLVHRPGTTFSLQLANLRGSRAILDPQLGNSPRPVCTGWGLCFLLLGLPQAQRHSHLPPECCLHPHTSVSQGWELGSVSLGVPGVLELPLMAWYFCSYHTGSLAFGALILSLVQIARVILEYIDHKVRGEQRSGAGEGPAEQLNPWEVRGQCSNLSPLAPRSPEPRGPLHHVLLQVLPLVSGKVYQVPKPQRIYHGEAHCLSSPLLQGPDPPPRPR